MNKEQTNTEAKKPVFSRKERIGFNFLDIRKSNGKKEPSGKSAYVKITSYESARMNKTGETNPFFEAVDLETGETGSIFIDGGLKAQFSKIKPENAVGRSFEIIWKGQEDAMVEIDGKMTETEVNKYDVFELN